MSLRQMLVVLLAVLALGACGGDASLFTTAPIAPAVTGPSQTTTPHDGDPGTGTVWIAADVLPPDDDTVIDTAAWGEVFDRRIVVRLTDGAGSAAAGEVASAVGGTVVTRIDGFSIVEIEITASGEVAIAAGLETLAGHRDVAIVTPSGVVQADWDVTDMPCGPLDALVLQTDGRGDQYRVIGVEDAWRLVKASGVNTTPPTVGIVDGSEPPTYHGDWVAEVMRASPGNPPGVLDAILADNAFTMTGVDVFGSGKFTSNTAIMSGVRTMAADGATVINVSLGGSADAADLALWHTFLQDMAKKYPDVVLVASAGNSAADSAATSPGGVAEPNLITVGGLDHQGERWVETRTGADGKQYEVGSNYMGTGGEVTLSVIARDVYAGISDTGVPVIRTGTSFAAPQVTAAAALLKALDPTLTGTEIKRILVDTAADEIPLTVINNDQTSWGNQQIDDALGGRVLRIDNAVWEVLSKRLNVIGTREELLDRATLNALARQSANDPFRYEIEATAPGGGNTTTVQIARNGSGGLIPNEDRLTTTDDVATWSWVFGTPGESAQVTLTRTDTGACDRIGLRATGVTATTVAVTARSFIGSVAGFFAVVGPLSDAAGLSLRVDTDGSVEGTVTSGSPVVYLDAFGDPTHIYEFYAADPGVCSGTVQRDGSFRCEGTYDVAVSGMGPDILESRRNTGTWSLTGTILDRSVEATLENHGTEITQSGVGVTLLLVEAAGG